MSLRALLFDFDGLIVDTESPAFASWRELYDEHGYELTLERWSAAVGTIDGFDPVGYLRTLAGDVDLDEALARRTARELELVEVEQLRPGVLGYLEEARRRRLATAIVSSGARPWIDRHLARLERAEHFDDIVTADGDAARAKPLPVLYLEALDRLGLAPGEAIAFEDSPNGVRAAKAAGLFCVAVPNSVTASLGLDEADVVVPSLAELPFARLLELAAASIGAATGVASRIAPRARRSDDRRVRVLIVDDHAGFRQQARALLEADGFEVVGEAATGIEAVEAAAALHPHLVLLDIQLPDLDGFEVARRLKSQNDGVDIVLTSSRDRSDYGSLVSESPARGFVPKAELSGGAIAHLLG